MPRILPLLVAAFAATSVFADLPATISGSDLVTGQAVKLEVGAAPRATVIAFVSAVCPCSGSHETVLENLRRKYEGQGFRFIGIHSNQDEPAAASADHFRASPMKFPILADSGAKIADAFGALKTPHTFVVNPKGEILYQGGVDDSHLAAESKKHFLADALAAIAAGRRPEVAQARTLGCVISRK